MSGVLDTLLGATTATSGATTPPTGTPGAMNWTDAYGVTSGATNTQTISGVTGTLTIGVKQNGGGFLGYSLNGAAWVDLPETFLFYNTLSVVNGDTLAWRMRITDYSGTISGTISVLNDNVPAAPVVIDTFNYLVTAP